MMLLQPPLQETESIFASYAGQTMEDIYPSCSTRQGRPILTAGASHYSTTHVDSSQSKPNRKKRLHTKSRHGCMNCKARKVKCQETRPYPCTNCLDRNVVCEYPPREQSQHLSQKQNGESTSTALREKTSPRGSGPFSSFMAGFPCTFTIDDMRFFHHFLTFAYPHLPFDSEEQWKTRLPAYACECRHLMHAILSLGATHLSSNTVHGSSYTALAIAHRGKSLKTLGEALSNEDKCTKTELDLLLATTYALLFQARFLVDGMADFAIMVRGCGILTVRILDRYQKSEMFRLLRPEDIFAHVTVQIPLTPYSDTDAVEKSIESLESIQPLLRDNSHRITYQSLLDSYKALQCSLRHGFIAYMMIYNTWERMNNDEFTNFLDPANHVSQILLLHYVALTAMLRPVFNLLGSRGMQAFSSDSLTECQWGRTIYDGLPPAMRSLVEWQAQFIELDRALVGSTFESWAG